MQGSDLDCDTVDWRLGPFRLEFDEGGKLASLKHILGAEANVLAHVVITKTYNMFDSHEAHVARVELKHNAYTFGDFEFEVIHSDFRSMLPVHGHPITHFAQSIAQARELSHYQADIRLASVVQEKNTITEPAMKKRATDTLDKARMPLQPKAAEREKSHVRNLD